MYNKLSLGLFSIFLYCFSLSTFADVCPPGSAVNCTNGNCTMDAQYSANWKLFNVIGKPDWAKGKGRFFVASNFPPYNVTGPMGCIYTSNFNDNDEANYISVNQNYKPNLSVPNDWQVYPNNYALCMSSFNDPGPCQFITP